MTAHFIIGSECQADAGIFSKGRIITGYFHKRQQEQEDGYKKGRGADVFFAEEII